jgi:hypothetical protein
MYHGPFMTNSHKRSNLFIFCKSINKAEMDAYTELKELSAMKGSLNAVVSHHHHLRRPPSLSESCAWNDFNVHRASEFFSEVSSESPKTLVQTPPNDSELFLVNTGLRFLFHITLISIFETIFFFMYISTLEDSGITKTINYFISSAVSSCTNFTEGERNMTDIFLDLFLNTTQISDQAHDSFYQRSMVNHHLFQRAWIYVGIVSGLFVLLTIYSCVRRIRVIWKPLILENIGLVTLLAAYEYMFFSTIIFPFEPLSAQEISENAVLQLQSSCGLLLP